MSLLDELRDPWGLLVGGLSGGMAWAVLAGTAVGAAALPVGIGVGVGVLGVKAVSGLLLGRGRDDARPPVRRPGADSDAAHWLNRAEIALEALRHVTPPSALQLPVTRAAGEAGATVEVLERLAGQVAALDDVLARLDVGRLAAEAADLEARAARASSPEVRSDLARGAAAVADRLAVHRRLLDARTTLLARMQAVALGLEGLETRLLELVALAGTGPGLDDPTAQVAALSSELEGLREGLAEAEALSRGALAAGPSGRTPPGLTD
ncbi:MAG: hypothetical protein JWM64_1158 [Frankiales bacterium]|nr:hypothetical protein [Frankiales bacterium]